jgi:hypothetical protein
LTPYTVGLRDVLFECDSYTTSISLFATKLARKAGRITGPADAGAVTGLFAIAEQGIRARETGRHR